MLIEQMWRMMLYNALGEPEEQYDHNVLGVAIQRYDRLWEEWQALAREPLCVTIYTDQAFRNKGEGSIGELVSKIRKPLKNRSFASFIHAV